MPLEFEEPIAGVITNNAPLLKYTNPGREATITPTSEATALESDCHALSVAAQQRRKSYIRWKAGLGALGLGLMALFSLVQMAPDAASNPVYGLLLGFIAVALFGISGFLSFTCRNKQFRILVQTVISANDTAATGALIDVLGIDDAWAARQARRHLTRLAPRWTEADLAPLTPEQRDGLRRVIDGVQTRRHADASGAATGQRYAAERSELRTALCTALGRLGNHKDYQVLLRLAHLLAVSPSVRRVRDAAQAAARVLDARLAEQHRPHTLLRASDAPATSPTELVRAAESPSTTPPKHLLRPG